MNRLEFMQQLESLLADISQSEREEALKYYNDYLNDAGVENEQEVLESLGTPAKLAEVIKGGLGDGGAAGEFTENGYKNYTYGNEPANGLIKRGEGKKRSGGMTALIIILCIFASPLLIAIGTGIFGGGLGILGGILGLFLSIAALGIALFLAALVLLGIGIAQLFTMPLAGIALIGAGLLTAGISLFFIWLTVWICGVAIPWIVRGIVSIFSKIFHRQGGQNA